MNTKVTDTISAITELKNDSGTVRAYIDNATGDLIAVGQIKTDDGAGTPVTQTAAEKKLTRNETSTGLLTGGEVTVNGGNPALFDISAGEGFIVDQYTDPDNVVTTNVTWSSQTGVALTGLATADATLLYINDSGTLIQEPLFSLAQLSEDKYRDTIVVAIVAHPDRTQIDVISSIGKTMQNSSNDSTDIRSAIGIVNLGGNLFSPNGANLSLDRSAGKTFIGGANIHTDPKQPNTVLSGAESPVSFRYLYQNAGGGVNGWTLGGFTTVFNPTQYDDGSGTLAAVPSGEYSIQRIVYVPTSGQTYVLYGQNTYAEYNDALKAVADEPFVLPTANSDLAIRCSLILRQDVTALNTADVKQVTFAHSDKFGQRGFSYTNRPPQDASTLPLASPVNGTTNAQAALDDHEGRIDSIEGWDTDNLNEGSGNLYYTEARVTANASVAANTAHRNDTGNPHGSDTDDIPEGVSNLYYTEGRVSANTDVAANTAARHTHNTTQKVTSVANFAPGATYSIVTGMTITPPAGTYLVIASGSWSLSSYDNNTQARIALALNNTTPITGTLRFLGYGQVVGGGGADNNDQRFTFHTADIITVNGSEAINLIAESPNTCTVFERNMVLINYD